MNTQTINNKRNVLTALCLLALPVVTLAQENEVVATTSYFSNALFNTLLVTIVLLAVLVMALSSVLKNISNSDALLNKLRSKGPDAGSSKTGSTVGIILLFVFTSLSNFAQTSEVAQAVAKDDGRIGGLDQFTFYFMVTTIFIEFLVVMVLIHTIRYLLKTEIVALEGANAVKKPKEKTILDVLSDAVDVENEESILLDHDYDGIKELDNNLPPWWKYGFYLTIIVAIVYLFNYHIAKTSPLQAEEYNLAMKKAEADIAAFMKNSANNVDENTVKMLDNASDLAAGKDLFINTCSPCHGKLGEGTVGPNLTDDYWIHSGGIKDIFKTIKYGWPEKGMKSWKEDFSPMQIAQLTSYIRTLRGTNPPKPKDKQGDLYIENAQSTDSTAVITDSLKVVAAAAADTLKK